MMPSPQKTPKGLIARTLDVLAGKRAAIRAIEGEHAKFDAEVAALDAELDRRSALRRDIVENGDAAILAQHDRETAAVEAERSRARDLRDGRALRLQTAREDEAEAARQERYEAARKGRDEAAKAVRDLLTTISNAWAEVHAIAAADLSSCEPVNRDLPAGALPLVPAEALVRSTPPGPAEVVSERLEWRWCYALSGDPLPPDLVGDVQASGNRGVLPPDGQWLRQASPVERRRFRVRQVRRAVPRVTLPSLASLVLPPLLPPPEAEREVVEEVLPVVEAETLVAAE